MSEGPGPLPPEWIAMFCPMGGLHKLRPWAGDGRRGQVCPLCHKTWTERDGVMIPTFAAT